MVFCFLIGASFTIQAQNNHRKHWPGLNVALKLTSLYDDNILKYSDKYLERFMNQEDEGRFHIKTYDDIVVSPEIELNSTFRIFPKLNTTVDAGYRLTAYAINHDKNRSYLNAGLRQFISKQASIKVSYNYIPEFYIRHFRDDDWVELVGYTPESFKPFSFSKDNYNIEVQNTFLKNTRVRIAFDYAKYYYNKHFTEYDCNNQGYEINMRQAVTKNLKLEAGYTYTESKAKGYDEPGETRQTSDDSDGSYNEDAFLIRVLWNLPKFAKRKHSIDAKFEFNKHYYTSGKLPSLDPLHVGRIDDNILLNGSYTLQISKAAELSVFYNWFNRKTDSVIEENRQFISEEKDYNQHQIGLAFTYKFRL